MADARCKWTSASGRCPSKARIHGYCLEHWDKLKSDPYDEAHGK